MVGMAAENRRVLIIDDNCAIHADYRKILCPESSESVDVRDDEASRNGASSGDAPESLSFELKSAFQGQEGVLLATEALYAKRPFAVAFVDMRMPPGWDGVRTVQHLWEVDPDLQIVLCTAYADHSSSEIIRELGATDNLMIIKKPFDADEIHLACRALTEKWRMARSVAMRTESLEHDLAMRSREIMNMQDLTVFALAELADSRDPETGEHLVRMREYSQIVAQQLRMTSPYEHQIDRKFLDDLYRSSPLHDIGKVGIEDAILLKPGKLTNAEFDRMKLHVLIGANALRSTASHAAGGFLKMAVEIAEFHHERFDGSGYLCGLKGQEIPLAARIVAVADVFDALTSDRVYKRAIPPSTARKMIEDERGQHFDPVVVDAFEQCFDRLLVAGEFPDAATPRVQPDNSTHGVPKTLGCSQPLAEVSVPPSLATVPLNAEQTDR